MQIQVDIKIERLACQLTSRDVVDLLRLIKGSPTYVEILQKCATELEEFLGGKLED